MSGRSSTVLGIAAGVAAAAAVGFIVVSRGERGARREEVAPPQLTESQQGSVREEGISLERAVAIARKECEGVIRIPDDAIVETKREGGNIVTTFRIPIKTPRVGAS